MAIIQDSSKGFSAKVDSSNRLAVRSTAKTETFEATKLGESFNINTGLITLTSAAESGVLYIKNNEDRDVSVDSLVFILAPTTGGAASDSTRVRVYKNSTAGTLISTALSVSANQNRNFGASRILSSLAYKGATGNTVTDGSVIIDTFVSPGTRLTVELDIVITKGKSIAVTYQPNTGNTSMKCMVAASLHIDPVI